MVCHNCQINIPEQKKYCSLRCRNIYVNKHLRDYSKNSAGLLRISNTNREDYYRNPKFCKRCGTSIDYHKRENQFCGHSCSASVTNVFRKQEKPESVLKQIKMEYDKNPKQCEFCYKMMVFNKRKQLFCDKHCKREYHRGKLNDYQKYKMDCQFKFNLKDYPDEFNFALIDKYGWYKAKNKGNNLNGVSRDHIFSIRKGFDDKINSNVIAHPANCQLLQHIDNDTKNSRCDITIDDLTDKINYWDIKYKKGG